MDTICVTRVNEIVKQIEKMLFQDSDDAFRGLVQLTHSREYQVLSECDNVLHVFRKCMEIFQLEASYGEKTVLQRARNGEIFCIGSVNEQYSRICFLLYRLDSDLPQSVIDRSLRELDQSGTSAEMIKYIADRELERTKTVLLKVCEYFLSEGQLLRAGRILLYMREEGYDAEVLLMLANVFLQNQNYSEALNILAEIENPDETIKEMKIYLQKYIS